MFCGVSRAEFLEEEAPRLEKWLNANMHGSMSYMENHFDKRLDPRLLVDGAKSVVSLALNYFPEKVQLTDSYKISKYAYGEDYHFIIKYKLKELMKFIQSEIGEVEGRVRRVEPAVNEGTVVVDVDLTGDLPPGARPELQVEGIIFQEQFPNTLFVAKPNLVKTNSTVSLYRLDADGDYAERISVKLGEASVDRVQVLGGLQELDRIILSDSSSWQEHDVILLN